MIDLPHPLHPDLKIQGYTISLGNCAYGGKEKSVKCDYGSPFVPPPHYLNALNLMSTSRSNSALWSRPTTTIKKSKKGHSAETLKPKAAEPFYQGSHDPFHRIGAKRPADAVAEMFNMLHKDYYTRSRRKPPINNSMPLKDPHVKP
ncbi:hypothetical protein B296_00001071 [Ensete ventricosum]|uniref:Uncharacterized protein n=1 Tax=Ensete ventricosum TaxID=4639 RepID=A0A427BAU5_ENSVE|nr:hypothetical protein B296_00001071 [Ensete ventricosum]